jgi:hypothetical protein
MKYNGTSWVTVGSDSVSAGEVAYTSIAIDTEGMPIIVYQDLNDSSKATVMKYNGSSWGVVGNAGFSAGKASFTTIALDISGIPYVSYQDYSDYEKATVMKYNGSSWVPVGSPDFSAGIVQFTSIAIDRNNTPYVVYQDSNSKATVKKYGFPNGVKNLTNIINSISIFPNPTHNSFTLYISSPTKENATITMTNMLGEKVKELTTMTNTDKEIQTDVTPGIYFISASTSMGTLNKKIVVE